MRWIVRLFAVLFLFAVLAVGLLAMGLVRHGFSARDKPTSAEATLAGGLRRLAIPAGQRSLRSPSTGDEASLKEGREHFADHCALCHGNDGKGMTEMGMNMYPKPPDMTSRRTQSLSDGEIFYIIKNGVRLTGMPAWGHDDEENWHLVQFIRHLPKMTPEELREMEGLNPKSPHEMQEQENENRFPSGDNAPEGEQHHP